MLSIGVSFVLKFFWKFDKNFKNSISGPIYMADPVDFLRIKVHASGFRIYIVKNPRIKGMEYTS